MAQQEKIKIPRASDRAVLDFFRDLTSEHGIEQVSITAQGAISIGSVNLAEKPSEDLSVLMELDSALIATVSIAINGLNIAYYRGGSVQPEAKSPIFDEIGLTYNPQQAAISNTDRLKIVAKISSKLHAFQPGRHIDSGLSTEQNDLIAIHQSNLERLEKLNEDLIRQGIEYRDSLDGKFDSKSEKLDKEYEEKKEFLGNEFKQKQDALAQKMLALEDRAKELDDRDNTHVRRELRKSLLDEAKARSAEFVLTKGTQRLRWPVHIACTSLFAVAERWPRKIGQRYKWIPSLI